MRKLTSLEKALVGIGVLFVIGGLWAMLFQEEFVASMPSSLRGTVGSYMQNFNVSNCRLYGALSMAVGIGMCAFAILPLKR